MRALEDWKIKISVLWLFWTVAFVITLMVGFFEPGALEHIMEGELYGIPLTPELILGTTIMMLVPLAMAFLSLILKDSIDRWANVALGIVYTGICVLDWLGSPTVPVYGVVLYVAKIAASVLIVWYAWKSRSL